MELPEGFAETDVRFAKLDDKKTKDKGGNPSTCREKGGANCIWVVGDNTGGGHFTTKEGKKDKVGYLVKPQWNKTGPTHEQETKGTRTTTIDELCGKAAIDDYDVVETANGDKFSCKNSYWPVNPVNVLGQLCRVPKNCPAQDDKAYFDYSYQEGIDVTVDTWW